MQRLHTKIRDQVLRKHNLGTFFVSLRIPVTI